MEYISIENNGKIVYFEKIEKSEIWYKKNETGIILTDYAIDKIEKFLRFKNVELCNNSRIIILEENSEKYTLISKEVLS